VYLARTLAVIFTVTDTCVTLVGLSARHVTLTRHTAWETVVAEWTPVTTTTSILFYTTTLTGDDVTLTG